MFSQSTQYSLTRRGSKQLVELIIGIIGVLGIMLAQVESNNSNPLPMENGKTVIGASVSTVTAQIDWLEILF